MAKKFEGKVALVTGASKGIGAAIALYLAKEGASVVVNYSSSKEGADKIVSEIKQAGGKAIALHANMALESDIKSLFEETQKAFGKLDILVNNAGIFYDTPIESLTPEQFHKIFDINVLGLLLATKTAVHYFGESGGSVINISSIASTYAAQGMSVYSASKGAVDAITKSLAKELGPKKIRVNGVAPGLVETEGTQTGGFMDSDWGKAYAKDAPLRRIGQPRDIAEAVSFLASEEASWITGETINVSGGFIMS